MPDASQIPQSVEDQQHLTSIHVDEWINNDVFRLRWWILLGLLVASLIIWWLLLDKSRLKETCLYTALGYIFALAINEYGEELILWDYPTDIIAIFPPLSSINLLMLPLVYSLTYQYFTEKRRFVWAVLIVTAVMCFVLEPLFSWGNLYQLINWKYYFSYPLFILMALLVRALTVKIFIITGRSKNAAGR